MSAARASGPIPRDQIRDMILFGLAQPGSIINKLESGNRRYPGDSSQQKYQKKPVWHKRSDLIIYVAKKLRINPELWGPNRVSNNFYNPVDQEIAKLRKKNVIIEWNSSRHFGIFRLGFDVLVTKPQMSTTANPAIPASNIADTSENNLKRTFLSIMTKGKKDNTYKFTLAKVLLDYCRDTTDTARTHAIPYEYLADKFLRYYWYQEYKFRMKQDFRIKSKPKVIRAINDVFGQNPPADFKLLDCDDVTRAKNKILSTVFGHARSKTSLVVPRFQNVPAGRFTQEIRAFYDYDDDKQEIYLKPEAFEFFRKNNAILSRVVLAEWARFLEKINHSLPRLVAKIDQDNMVRGSLVPYHKIYAEHTDHCFYCNDTLERYHTHVDHFIPWSYMFEDSAWNLVLACQQCNCKKSDSLPQSEFRDLLIHRNTRYYTQIKKLKLSLDQLDTGRGWEPEIANHYTNCHEYGFNTIHLP